MSVIIDFERLPYRGALNFLAAAAVVVAAVMTAIQAIATAVAEQNQQNDDPADVAATETVIAHKSTSRNFNGAAMPLIPRYSVATIL